MPNFLLNKVFYRERERERERERGIKRERYIKRERERASERHKMRLKTGYLESKIKE